MGVSTDAILTYGFELPDDERLEEFDYDDRLKALGLEIMYHCSDESPMYLLVVANSGYRAWRGYPVEIPPILPEYGYKQIDLLKGMEIIGVTPEDTTPHWYLVSWWG